MRTLELATLIAAKLEKEFLIGNASQFCDEPTDFDNATTEEIAAVIEPFLLEHQKQ